MAKLEFTEDQDTGTILGSAMEITDQKEADEYFEALVCHMMKYATNPVYKTRIGAEQVVRSNLGYYAGYYNQETMERVQRLFSCSHPIFGKVMPTAEEAFKKGLELGEQMKGK
jgi:hypothetical protein